MKIFQREIVFSLAFTFVSSYIISNETLLKNVKDELWQYVDDTNILDLYSTGITSIQMTKMKANVYFRLFTQANPEKFELLHINDFFQLKRSNFDFKKATKMITHGWKGTPNSLSCILIKNAFLNQGDYNVIIIDWSSVSNLLYVVAQSYVNEVALEVALMINFLASNGMKLDNTTLIGHSLGAHVMGIAGYNTQSKISYIVGLDPAGPLFVEKGPGYRISSADGQFVEVIHTNAGLLGLKNSVGHRDFFPNGGRMQSGCIFPCITVCSHSRSYEIYAESVITRNKFYGKKCDSYINYLTNQCLNSIVAVVGDSQLNNPRKTGDFYFKTNNVSPFSMGICGAEFNNIKSCK